MTDGQMEREKDDPSPEEARKRIADALRESGLAHSLLSDEPELTLNSQEVLRRRYLSKDREGNLLETCEGMFLRVSENLAQADANYGTETDSREATRDEFHRAMRSLRLLPNSPTMMNAGRELQQLSACFVLPVEDSLDDIFDKVKKTALIHKSGGGTGFSFSRLRPEGSMVGSTGGVASGPVSFIRAFDTGTDVVKQGGTRRGANMGILHVTHPDILKFIHVKDDGRTLQNFNISVAATDDFMERVKSGEDYELVNPHDGQVAGTLNARDVFTELAHSAWATGDPGLLFIDAVNRGNPNPQLGEIESTNPCGEQELLPYESCNLASINLTRMTRFTGGGVEPDWELLEETVNTAVHLLDNVIDMNRYPIPEIERMTRSTRRIGLGVMGLADLLMMMGIPYDSDEALGLAGSVLGAIREQAHRASRELAGRRGTFPEWKRSVYNRGNGGMTGNPMRNSAPTTIAPTGTISIIAGVSSGIEPAFALAYERNVMDGTRMTEVNPVFEAVARHEGFHSKELMDDIARTGTLENTSVPEWVKRIFRTSHDIHPDWHVAVQANAQRYVDNSVSKTVNLPNSATPEGFARAYMAAYEGGCKGITCYRDGSKENQVLSTGVTGAGIPQQEDVPPNGHRHVVPRDRPQAIEGVTERVRTGHGNMYVTINFDGEGQPFEVFGNLGKAGGCDSAQMEAISRLASLSLRSGIDPDLIIEQMQGITCCPIWDNGESVRSSPDAVAIAVKRHLEKRQRREGGQPEAAQGQPGEAVSVARGNPEADAVMEARTADATAHSARCPECNSGLIRQEGCVRCGRCGWNRCE